MENFSRLFQNKKEKKKYDETEFYDSFKIKFLPPFTGCSKVLEKMCD